MSAKLLPPFAREVERVGPDGKAIGLVESIDRLRRLTPLRDVGDGLAALKQGQLDALIRDLREDERPAVLRAIAEHRARLDWWLVEYKLRLPGDKVDRYLSCTLTGAEEIAHAAAKVVLVYLLQWDYGQEIDDDETPTWARLVRLTRYNVAGPEAKPVVVAVAEATDGEPALLAAPAERRAAIDALEGVLLGGIDLRADAVAARFTLAHLRGLSAYADWLEESQARRARALGNIPSPRAAALSAAADLRAASGRKEQAA